MTFYDLQDRKSTTSEAPTEDLMPSANGPVGASDIGEKLAEMYLGGDKTEPTEGEEASPMRDMPIFTETSALAFDLL